jgi:hypothetical protein
MIPIVSVMLTFTEFLEFCSSCLAHVVNLVILDFMSHVTKIAVTETTTAIWEYDPSLTGNRVLNGSLDIISAIRTLAVKVCIHVFGLVFITLFTHRSQIQSSGQRIEYFNQLQIQCGIKTPLKIPLHGNTRWGTAFGMLDRAYQLRQVCHILLFFLA